MYIQYTSLIWDSVEQKMFSGETCLFILGLFPALEGSQKHLFKCIIYLSAEYFEVLDMGECAGMWSEFRQEVDKNYGRDNIRSFH